ncbi:MAG: PEP-CTERM sorting domain-containing protein [Phycisphaeraceae bacterium]|nr:PEP-CTERM sorting domain-containing protein [Phycisphaeraceae bacterium]
MMIPNKKRFVQSLCTAGVLLSCSLAQAAISTGLQGYYKLNENSGTALGTTVVNSGSVAENGVIFSSTGQAMDAVNEPGQLGTSYHFDGIGGADATTNNAVLVGTTIGNNLNATDTVTISAWVNPDLYRSGTTASSRSYILGTDTDIVLAVGLANAGTTGKILWSYKAGLNTDQTVSSTNLVVPVNEWSMVSITRAGATSKMYFNGVLIDTFTRDTGNFQLSAFDHDLDGGTTPVDVGLYLGTIFNTPARDYIGYLDEVGIWVAEARTEEEIAVIHGLSYFAQVELNDTAMDDVLAVFNAASGSALAGGYTWGYVTGLASTTKGEIGGSTAGGDAWIALDASGNGVQIIPEPASMMLLAAGVSMVLSRRRK